MLSQRLETQGAVQQAAAYLKVDMTRKEGLRSLQCVSITATHCQKDMLQEVLPLVQLVHLQAAVAARMVATVAVAQHLQEQLVPLLVRASVYGFPSIPSNHEQHCAQLQITL